MKCLRTSLHWCWDNSLTLTVLSVLVIAALALVGLPVIVLWLADEIGRSAQEQAEQEELERRISETGSQEQVVEDTWDKAVADIYTIGQQYTPHVMLSSMQIARLLRFAETWAWTEEDRCIEHVESEGEV